MVRAVFVLEIDEQAMENRKGRRAKNEGRFNKKEAKRFWVIEGLKLVYGRGKLKASGFVVKKS